MKVDEALATIHSAGFMDKTEDIYSPEVMLTLLARMANEIAIQTANVRNLRNAVKLQAGWFRTAANCMDPV